MKILLKNHLCVLYVRIQTQLIIFWTPVIPNENINKYSSLSKKMREIFIPVAASENLIQGTRLVNKGGKN